MTEALQTTNPTAGDIMESVIVKGDLTKLSAGERVAYYNAVCQSVGLNPLTKPFDYITLNGKLTLYAKKDCTDQLRKRHGVSLTITSREQVGDTYLVIARATMPDGRTDESLGAVPIGNLKGDMFANALMKAETKAKRRVTLSICGLGMLDETELETIPTAAPPTPPQPKQIAAKPTPAPAPQPEQGSEIIDAEIDDRPIDAITANQLRALVDLINALVEFHTPDAIRQSIQPLVDVELPNLDPANLETGITNAEAAKVISKLQKQLEAKRTSAKK